jgi:hypothetical protein
MIWYDCGASWASAHWARKDLGLDAILCCPGPSLKNSNPENLKGPGRKVFAVNTAYPTVKPDVWVGMDEMHCYDENLLHEPFPKVFRGTYCEMSYAGKKVRDCPETYFADVAQVPPGKTMLDLREQNTKFAWHNHTLGVALHMMIWMGAKNIYLVGCDMGGEADYCHELTLTPDQRSRNHRLYAQQVVFLEKLAKAAKAYGITIWSSTPNSPLNRALPYRGINEVTAYKPKESKMRYVTDRPCTPVTVLRSGGEYKLEHVQRLAKMVPGLVCLSDVEIEGVPTVKLRHDWPGWWAKMELFGPAFETDILHIDLDTTVLEDITPFLKVGKTTLLDDFYYPGTLSSGFMYIHQDDKARVWKEFTKDPQAVTNKYKLPPLIGDQGFLNTVLKAQTWQKVLPNKVVSYKVHCQGGIPQGTSIVCFHGKPRPWDVGL